LWDNKTRNSGFEQATLNNTFFFFGGVFLIIMKKKRKKNWKKRKIYKFLRRKISGTASSYHMR
jgi:hypothetical protein